MGDVGLDALDHLVVVLDNLVQELAVRTRLQHRDQGPERLTYVSDEPQVHRGPAAEVKGLVVDLDDRLPGGKERMVGEVRAEHQEEVAIGERLRGATPPEKPGHAD